MNLLTVGAAFGFATLVFQHGIGTGLLGIEHQPFVDAWAPLFFFALLFGLSMDYQLFLLAAIRERYEATGDTKRAIREGIARTGRPITNAALIMIIVFIAFGVTGPDPTHRARPHPRHGRAPRRHRRPRDARPRHHGAPRRPQLVPAEVARRASSPTCTSATDRRRVMDREEWNDRYRTKDLVWTANANQFVVAEVAGLPAGHALDLAAGEGRNAVWLAEQGWQVTAVDYSDVAITKARELAAERNVALETVVADATEPLPGQPTFDLVVVAYLQLPEPDRSRARSAMPRPRSRRAARSWSSRTTTPTSSTATADRQTPPCSPAPSRWLPSSTASRSRRPNGSNGRSRRPTVRASPSTTSCGLADRVERTEHTWEQYPLGYRCISD